MRFNRWKAELLGMLGIFALVGLMLIAIFFSIFVPESVSICLFVSILIMSAIVITVEYRSWNRQSR